MRTRMRLFNSFVTLILAGVLVTGCKTGTKKDKDNDLTFTTVNVDKTYHLMDNPDNPNCNLQLSFTYPVKYDNKETLAKIQKLFVDSYFGEAYESFSPEEAAARYTEDYLEMYKELEDDFREDVENSDDTPVGAWYSYYEMSNNEISYNRNDLLSYLVYFENYTGGAHGSHAQTNHVINLQTGEYLTEEDIFVEGFEDALVKILIDTITEQNNLTDPKELENIGFFSIDEIYPNGNFLVDDEGITYTFNEYEIAAYVVGVTRVEIPYTHIQHLLRNDSPVYSLINN